ncbi:hypothetical protein GCM10007414_34570 [Agarivorans gilvus]|uniref:Uncharacterized protein n=1 Tax=Agarivorans gilvus TaxID=680279 RepID=A0ABQ1I5A6_9ALTE|nr:hypothetical protein GCM10007414_34570 [Agarivorans gilvus]
MEYLILTTLAIIVLIPLVIPWGKVLNVYCITVWFSLWVLFYVQTERENLPSYDAGIISDDVVLGVFILAFILVVVLRILVKLIFQYLNEQ